MLRNYPFAYIEIRRCIGQWRTISFTKSWVMTIKSSLRQTSYSFIFYINFRLHKKYNEYTHKVLKLYVIILVNFFLFIFIPFTNANKTFTAHIIFAESTVLFLMTFFIESRITLKHIHQVWNSFLNYFHRKAHEL